MTAIILSPGTLPHHVIVGAFDSPIPLWVFLLAAGVTVFSSTLLPSRAQTTDADVDQRRQRTLPQPIVRTLATLGLIAILWVLVQGVIGGSSAARVDVLFLWLTGWVLVPVLAGCGLHLYPIIDPWRRIALAARRHAPRELPAAPVAPAWIGIAAVAAIITLELVWTGGRGGPALLAALLIHGTWVVAGRLSAADPELWAARHDPLTIVNRFLSEVSGWQLTGDPDLGVFTRQSSRAAVSNASSFALATLLVGAVIYDGLSQTEIWFRTFGLPTSSSRAVLLLVVVTAVGVLCLAATLVSQRSGSAELSARALVIAGLRPVAFGYILAHYGPSVVAAAPYWLVAIADPLQRGWNLFGLAFVASSIAPLPGIAVWSGQVIAVVGGHVAGIRVTHQLSQRQGRNQIATTILLVALTMLTLWTLGQSVVAAA